MFMVVFVVDNPDHCSEILEMWEQAGVRGATILESTGLGRYNRARLRRDDFSIMPSISQFFEADEVRHRTIFSVVQTQQQIDALVAAASRVVGDLNQPNTGVMFVLPVLQVYGIPSVA